MKLIVVSSDGAVMTLTNVTSTDGPNPDYVQTTVTFKGAAYPMTAREYWHVVPLGFFY